MSLGIVVLTDEGVVIAAESLGTLLSHEQAVIHSECKKCGQKGKPNLMCTGCGETLGPAPTLSRQFPVTHTFHCQKVFKVNHFTGAIIVGSPSFGVMKAQHAIFAFINWLAERGESDGHAEEIFALWQCFCQKAKVLEKHVGPTELVFAGIKDKANPSPFSQTMIIKEGGVTLGNVSAQGIVAVGVHEILDKMFGDGGIHQYPVKHFPLQDAVEFAEFLMQTQIGVDRYTARLPRVGGEIDLAVVHPNHGFVWVKQKALQRVMEAPLISPQC